MLSFIMKETMARSKGRSCELLKKYSFCQAICWVMSKLIAFIFNSPLSANFFRSYHLAASCKNIFAEKLFGLRWATTSLTQGKQTLSGESRKSGKAEKGSGARESDRQTNKDVTEAGGSGASKSQLQPDELWLGGTGMAEHWEKWMRTQNSDISRFKS